jgi:hypothetical protein
MGQVAGLPALRLQLDRAFANFRRDPSLENAKRLHEAVRIYGGSMRVAESCMVCGNTPATYEQPNPYNRMMDGYRCAEHTTWRVLYAPDTVQEGS